MFPTGPLGGAGRLPAANAADLNPRRAISPNTNILSFLARIGVEAGAQAQGGQRPSAHQMVQVALELGDIAETGTTQRGMPVYSFTASSTHNELRFTLHPDRPQITGMSYPPHISHQPGQVHSSLESALWGGWCYENPTEMTQSAYHNLKQGISARYGNQN